LPIWRNRQTRRI